MARMVGVITRLDQNNYVLRALDGKSITASDGIELTIRSTGEVDLQDIFGLHAEGVEVEVTIVRRYEGRPGGGC